MDSFVVKVVKLLLIVAVLRHMKLGVKHSFKKLMLVTFYDIVKRSILDICAPEGGHLRNLIFSSDTSLQKLIVSSDSSSDDVSIIASNTAINEKIIFGVLLVNILVNKVYMRVPLALLELSWLLRLLFTLFRLCFTSSNLSLLDGLRRSFFIIFVITRASLFLIFIEVLLCSHLQSFLANFSH